MTPNTKPCHPYRDPCRSDLQANLLSHFRPAQQQLPRILARSQTP